MLKMNSLSIVVRRGVAGQAVVALEGELNNATVSILEPRLLALLEEKPPQLIFDLGGLRFVTSAGIRLFLMAYKRVTAHGGKVLFAKRQPQVQEVFEIMGSLPDVQIFENDSELDAYLMARQKSHLEA